MKILIFCFVLSFLLLSVFVSYAGRITLFTVTCFILKLEHDDIAKFWSNPLTRHFCFFTMRQSLFYFSGIGKFCPALGWGSSHETLKVRSIASKNYLRAP